MGVCPPRPRSMQQVFIKNFRYKRWCTCYPVAYLGGCCDNQLCTWEDAATTSCSPRRMLQQPVVHLGGCCDNQLCTWEDAAIISCSPRRMLRQPVVHLGGCCDNQLFTWEDAAIISCSPRRMLQQPVVYLGGCCNNKPGPRDGGDSIGGEGCRNCSSTSKKGSFETLLAAEPMSAQHWAGTLPTRCADTCVCSM
eukprot:1159002-Pelagomonas_calceolata.AAC.4